MDRGALVPGELTAQLVSQCLAQASAWLLDGFPVTLAQ
jgi:adenylate kinase family enzyme